MNKNLDEGEILMLQDYCKKAKLEDGLEILDLGCGWGSLSLFLAQVVDYSLRLSHFAHF
jgi:cyclopropane fatty-acyl-phospholipid synthase-like methyltransferase